MDDESLKNYLHHMDELWESFAPVREMVRLHPELKDSVVELVTDSLNRQLTANFLGPVHLLNKEDKNG